MRDGGKTKERINRAALGLFVEKGVAETTTRDISRQAGIAEGTLYRHYPSKDALAWELFVENFTAIGRTLNDIQRSHHTTRDKLAAIIRHFCQVFDSDSVVFSYLFLVRHQHMLKLNPRMPNPYLVFRTVIREGTARGEIPRQDIDVATSMVMGIILQVIDARLLGRRILRPIESLTDTLIQTSFRILKI